mmetsp:Transcript_35761/g.40772  ORF Transcript_35761/g.40772 Transcript_35761/m.40772 type:complete len:125 (+) Transcript_35761:2-376(+)
MRQIGNSSSSTPKECKVSYKIILSTFLLTEERRTNAMVDAARVTVPLEADKHTERESNSLKFGSIISKRSPFSSSSSKVRGGIASDLMNTTIESKSSADISRTLEKLSEVLSVTEKECRLRQYD